MRKDTTYQSTNNRAQQQSESPVVVFMGNVSPETVIVERYYQVEILFWHPNNMKMSGWVSPAI